MGVGRAGMETSMEVPKGTKSRSSLWFSSPTPRHRSTHRISEQDRCPVWAYLSVRARAHAHARSPARQGVGRGLGLWLESVQAPGLPEASQRSPRWRRDYLSSGVLEAECECGGARGPRGGNPGLQRESGPRPPAPPAPGGAGAAGGIRMRPVSRRHSRRTRGDRPLVERYVEPGGLFPTMHGRVTAPSC